MRVISGTARGTKLYTLEGIKTRPTTDRIKESIFNMIQFDLYGATVLDLFSGSGALGIEALSRGAMSCFFVESDPEAAKIIRKNIEKTHFDSTSEIIVAPVSGALRLMEHKALDIVFMDPPYLKGHIKNVFQLINQYNVVDDNGIIMVEHHFEDQEVCEMIENFKRIKFKKYGITCISFYRRQ